MDYTKNNALRPSVFRDPEKPTKAFTITPFALRELKKNEAHDLSLDWQRAGADFYEVWYNMGKDVAKKRPHGKKKFDENNQRHLGARLLSRGLIFMAMNNLSDQTTYGEGLADVDVVQMSSSSDCTKIYRERHDDNENYGGYCKS